MGSATRWRVRRAPERHGGWRSCQDITSCQEREPLKQQQREKPAGQPQRQQQLDNKRQQHKATFQEEPSGWRQLQRRLHDCHRHFQDLHRGLPGLNSCPGSEFCARTMGEKLQEAWGQGGGGLDGALGLEALIWDWWNEYVQYRK